MRDEESFATLPVVCRLTKVVPLLSRCRPHQRQILGALLHEVAQRETLRSSECRPRATRRRNGSLNVRVRLQNRCCGVRY